MKAKTLIASLLLALTLANPVLGVVSVTSAEDSIELVDTPVEKALNQLPEIKDDSREVTFQETGEEIITKTGDLEIEIPKDSTEPVVLKSHNNKPEVSIKLPETKATEEAEQISGNMVHFESEDTFSNIVQPTEDGVRFLTVIGDPSAPTEYRYDLFVEGDYILTEAINSEGEKGVIIMNADQSDIIAIINPAWAKDARGNDIPTWFEIRDNELLQHVNHRISGVIYPVTADPYVENFWWGRKVFFNRNETLNIIEGHLHWSTVVSFVPHWYFNSLGAYLYARSWHIRQFYNRGNCVAMNYTGGAVPTWYWEYGGRGCWW